MPRPLIAESAAPSLGAWVPALILVTAIVQVVGFGWTFASHDFIRDLLAAGDIASGQSFPLRGPIINGMVHVGPLWFYVMSIPLVFGGGLLAATIWAGLLSTLKAAAAWRLGHEIGGPRLAALVAALSLLPGWAVIHQLQFTQTIMLELMVYAAMLPLLRLWRLAGPRSWAAAGLWLGLAVQAHPVALFLLVPMAVIALRRVSLWRQDAPWMAIGAAVSLLPTLPMFWAEWRDGFPAIVSLQSFAATEGGAASLRGTLRVLDGLVVQGPQVMVALAAPLSAGALAAALFVVIGVAAAAGLPGAIAEPRTRKIVVVALLLAVLAAGWVASLRPTTVYYLALLAWPFLILALAASVHGRGRSRGDRARGIVAIIAALALAMLGSVVVIVQGQAGRITLPLRGMLDVAEGPAGAVAVATMPAWATEALARRTCGAATLVLRGELAAFLDFYQGIPWRWLCRPMPEIFVVASPAGAATQQRALMSPAALRMLGWPEADWSIAIALEPVRVLSSGAPVPQPAPTLRHPHRAFEPPPPVDVEREVVTHPGELLAVYAPLFIFDGGAILEARADGVVVAPVVSTDSGAVFEAPAAAAGHVTRWTLSLRGRQPGQIEMFTLRRPGDPADGR